tara:strand:- start:3943 stop:4815 length:873 start_codon:yes stop_codon:yes gene_type:complete
MFCFIQMRIDSGQTHLLLSMPPRFWAAFFTALILFTTGCASGPPKLPYPAFVQVDELEDVFMASLPGVRAKQLSGDPQTRRTSNRVDLPSDWEGTSGGTPGRSTELFVVDGELTIADVSLRRGGYAYLPSGSLGFNLVAKEGARIMYFVNDTDPESVIRSPIIIDSALLDWEDTGRPGVARKELRNDPGNGAKTWLVRVATGASQAWESSSALREGYLVTGNQQYSECLNGKVYTWQYAPGGYVYRPAGTISGGPDSHALTDSIWLFRETTRGEVTSWPGCVVQQAADEF